MERRLGLLLTVMILLTSSDLGACDSALSSLVGFRLVAATHVEKEQLRELSAEERTTIELGNGMSFLFRKTPRDSWGVGGLKTSVFVFSRSPGAREQDCCARLGYPSGEDQEVTLLISDSTYEATRVK